MQNEMKTDEAISNAEAKGFAGMSEESSAEGGRSTEEVRKAREANTKSDGGTHGGSHDPAAKEHHDHGGKEGNAGAHPF